MSPRVAVFGGSFNPPHVAHVLGAAFVLTTGEVDRVLIVPCFQHPFAKALAPFDDRLAMCRLAFAPLAAVEVSDVERDLGGESLTVRTLEHLATRFPDWRLRLVVGADVVAEMDRWTRPERVRALAPPLVLGRVGAPALPRCAGRAPRGLLDGAARRARAGRGPGPAAARRGRRLRARSPALSVGRGRGARGPQSHVRPRLAMGQPARMVRPTWSAKRKRMPSAPLGRNRVRSAQALP